MVYGAVRVIVNADDLGLSDAVNAAVFDALDRGQVRSVSVLANGSAFDGAVSGLRGREGVGVGVHLNLTEFSPLTDLRGLRPLDVRAEQIPAVIAEWGAQIQRVIDAGLVPDHLDSHQHIHYQPALFPALAEVSARFAISAVRGMAVDRMDVPQWHGLLQRLRAARFAGRLRRSGMETTDGFGSATLFRALREAGRLRGESFEIMVHPGNPAHAVYAEEMVWVAEGVRHGHLTPDTWGHQRQGLV